MMAPDPSARPDMVAVTNLLANTRAAPAVLPTSPPTRTLRDDRPPPEPTRALSAAVPGVPAVLPPTRPPRSPTWIPIAAAGVVVLIAIVLGVVLIGDGSDSNHNAAPPATTPTATTRSSSSTPSTPSRSAAKSSATTSKPATTSVPTAAELVQAIDDYYSLVPGDLDAGWQRLTPTYQQDTGNGRASYDAYWNTIDHVTVSGQRPRHPAPSSSP